MAIAEIRPRSAGARDEREKLPTVLVVLVSKDGAAWLKQCLLALSRQHYPRIGLLAVDNASSDGSADLLEASLGSERVIRLPENRGFPGAAAEALASQAAAAVDYVLLLHDDTVLAPDAIARMVEAAERLEGVGIVGPKVLDVEREEVLREVGQSVDRFGYAYSPLEEGEIDQGQYDRVREVLAVSSCAMLVSTRTVARIGLTDERLVSQYGDLDFCWRARIAGFRVLMTPDAVAYHRGAGISGVRAGGPGRRRTRYQRERAALASALKNYGRFSLLWVLPLWLLQAAVRALLLVARRRFGEAGQIASAVGWNVVHLPGTAGRRRRAQRARRVHDHRVHQFMAPTGVRIRRWMNTLAEMVRVPGVEAEDREAPSMRVVLGRFAAAHPVFVASVLGAVVALVAYRGLFTASPLAGGALPTFPAHVTDFFREFVSGVRTTGLGGTEAASPALALLGLGSVVTLGHPALLEKLMLLLLAPVAAVGAYRAVRSLVGERAPAVVAAAAYALSAAVLWAMSQGRLAELVFMAGLPWVAGRVVRGFDPRLTVGVPRWTIGAAAGLAVVASFFPGAVLAVAVAAVAWAVAGPRGSRRVRGLAYAAAAVVGAAALLFPLAVDLFHAPVGLADVADASSFAMLARLAPGPGPGTWWAALYLPAAAALAFCFASGSMRAVVRPSALAAVASTYLAWAAATGRLPAAVANPVAYVGVAAFSYALLVGAGLASLARDVPRAAFGSRQIGGALLALVLAGGLVAQAGSAAAGGWAVGPSVAVLPPAEPIVAATAGASYRILWLGRPVGGALTAPAGLPDGTVAAGAASVRYALTGPAGASVLDVARPAAGPGYRALQTALTEILAGPTRHGGALLAPFGIRYVVASHGALPAAALRRLLGQVDLDLEAAGGLTIFQNPVSPPTAAIVSDPTWVRAAAGRTPGSAVILPATPAVRLAGHGQRYGGTAPARSMVFLSQQFAGGWGLAPATGGRARPEIAFGWATAFRPAAAGAFTVRFGGQAMRTLEIGLLVLLWIVALWITRRPVRG